MLLFPASQLLSLPCEFIFWLSCKNVLLISADSGSDDDSVLFARESSDLYSRGDEELFARHGSISNGGHWRARIGHAAAVAPLSPGPDGLEGYAMIPSCFIDRDTDEIDRRDEIYA